MRRKLSAAAQPQGCPQIPTYPWGPGHQNCPSSGGQSAWRRGHPWGSGRREKYQLWRKVAFSRTFQVLPEGPQQTINSHQSLGWVQPKKSSQLSWSFLGTVVFKRFTGFMVCLPSLPQASMASRLTVGPLGLGGGGEDTPLRVLDSAGGCSIG